MTGKSNKHSDCEVVGSGVNRIVHAQPTDLEALWPDLAVHFGSATHEEVLEQWTSATLVRNPYLRVLSAYDQRRGPAATRRWGRIGRFEEYMRWLAHHANWHRDETLTHFRPATRYTHWPDGKQAVRHIFKLEQVESAQPTLLGLSRGGQTSDSERPEGRVGELLIHNNVRATGSFVPHLMNGHSSSSQYNLSATPRLMLCRAATGCEARELPLLLMHTEHTPETVAIVNLLYRRDFRLLNYTLLHVNASIGAQDVKENASSVFGKNGQHA